MNEENKSSKDKILEIAQSHLDADFPQKIKILHDFNKRVAAGGKITPAEFSMSERIKRELSSKIEESIKVMSMEEACEFTGLRPRTIRWHITRGNLPAHSDPADTRRVLFNRVDVENLRNKRNNRFPDSFSDAITTDEARKDLLKVQSERLKFKLAIERGDYVRTDICMILWGDMIRGCRAKLLTLPVKYSPLLMGIKTIDEIKNKLEAGIYEALNELAEIDLRALINENRTQEAAGSESPSTNKKNLSTAHKAKSKRVGRPGKAVKPGKQRRTGKMV